MPQMMIDLERVLKMRSYRCQSPDHEPDHAETNHSLAVIQTNFVVTAQPARFEEPAESAFHNPPLRQGLEASDLVTAAYNLQPQFAEGTQLFDPVYL